MMKPSTDAERRRYRNAHRKSRHGPDWRGWFDYWNGVCAGESEVGVRCGRVDMLEFHSPIGEEAPLDTGERILLCVDCHKKEHGFSATMGDGRVTEQFLQEDVGHEIRKCGSYQAWKEKYKVGFSIPKEMQDVQG